MTKMTVEQLTRGLMGWKKLNILIGLITKDIPNVNDVIILEDLQVIAIETNQGVSVVPIEELAKVWDKIEDIQKTIIQNRLEKERTIHDKIQSDRKLATEST